METYFITQIMAALGDGNIVKAGAWIAVFLIIWLEVRGVKNQLKHLNSTIDTKFLQGEKRFADIETKQNLMSQEIDRIKQITHPLEG